MHAAPAATALPAPPTPEHSPDAERLDRRLGTDMPIATVLELLQHARPTRFSPVGTTSTVFRMDMQAPIAAAFKVTSPSRRRAAVAEVAAFRLARCLNITIIAPTVTRRVALTTLKKAFVSSPRGTWSQVKRLLRPDEDGYVTGAAIYWIPNMHNLRIDSEAGMARMKRNLTQARGMEAGSHELAASVSTMIVFDYLIGNFDRYSGANARGDANHSTVFLRDHDAAFPPQLTRVFRRNLHGHLQQTQRFSKSFVTALRALNRSAIDREFGRDPAGANGPLLPNANIEGVLKRQREALAHIDRLIARYGEPAVLAFP